MKMVGCIAIGLSWTIIFAMLSVYMDVPHRYVEIDDRPPVFEGDDR